MKLNDSKALRRYRHVWTNSDGPSVQDLDTGEVLSLDILQPSITVDDETEEEDIEP